MAWLSVVKFEKSRKIKTLKMTPDFSPRFPKDKVYICKNDSTILVDGVVLNSNELATKYGMTFIEFVTQNAHTDSFPCLLRGPFTGFSASGNKVIAYGNQTGDTFVFYYYDNDLLVIGTDYNEVVLECRRQGKHLTFDKIYANHILSFGFAVEGHTVINEIHKSQPGCAVIFLDGEIFEKRYHEFVPKRNKVTIDDAVDELDILFRESTRRCFEKDLEYGYTKHLADMSGGLDSRITTWVAYTMGYRPITNMAYAKRGSQDEINGRLVAEHLGNEYLFESLDDVEFIYDLEKIVKMNFGLATYVGITGGYKMLSAIDFNMYGLEHTGQIGDVIIGSFCKKASHNNEKNPRCIQYSDHVQPIITERDNYGTREMFELYYRAFQGALMTHQIRRNYTEVVSPFLDVDLIQYCLNLPLEYRCGHKLYFRWIETKYPEAMKIPCTRRKPGFHLLTKKDIYHIMPTWVRHFAISLSKKLHLSTLISDKNGMNPFDYWYENNAEMRNFITSYFSEHIDEMKAFPDVVNDLRNVYTKGRTMDKLLVLTVLAAFHIYVFEE